jgi:carbon monoxide dehydrogenase subunit G
MLSTEASQEIARAPEDVFSFVADVRNDPKWHTDVTEATLTQGDGKTVGSVYEIKVKPQMGMIGGTVKVASYDAPRRIVFDVDMGKMKPTTTFTVQAEGTGARISRKVEVEPTGMMKLMAPLMSGMFRKRNAKFVGNLKQVLES